MRCLPLSPQCTASPAPTSGAPPAQLRETGPLSSSGRAGGVWGEESHAQRRRGQGAATPTETAASHAVGMAGEVIYFTRIPIWVAWGTGGR